MKRITKFNNQGLSLLVILVLTILSSSVLGEAIRPAVPDTARPIPLSAVRLTGGPLKLAQDKDAEYLLQLNPDRMMAGFYMRLGLEPKAPGYGGWDAPESRQLNGHIAGHYLSAVSLMYAATGDKRFKERADYLVSEMKYVQAKQGDGYLGALLGNDISAGGRGGAAGGAAGAAVAGGSGGGAGGPVQTATRMAQLLGLTEQQIKKLGAVTAADAKIMQELAAANTALNNAILSTDETKIKEAINQVVVATEKNALAQAYEYNQIRAILKPEQFKPFVDTLTTGRVEGKILFRVLSEGVIRSGGFDLNGMWSPWYVQHKIFAGLRDAYRWAGNKDALKVEVKYAGWVEGILSKLNDDQIQQMLRTEFGGMNEVLADLYADTGDKRWLDLSYKFEHKAMLEPLARHVDNIGGVHGNTTIPKLIGSAARYGYAGNPADLQAASYFADIVIFHHSFATGGNSVVENFPRADALNEGVLNPRTNETCNVYNMLKLMRRLFAYWPDAHYGDFMERALFNHILGSADTNDWATCYMVPVGQGVYREYEGNMLGTGRGGGGFTCCVGSGMESHALHGDGIYYEAGDKFWVNLYAPSTVEWSQPRINMEMQTDFPEGESATLKMTMRRQRQFTLLLRKPYWVGNGFTVKVNGDTIVAPTQASEEGGRGIGARGGRGGRGGRGPAPARIGSFVEINRTWRNGDTVEITLPKTLRLEPTPDNSNRAAIMWGPLVMAGDLGAGRRGGGRGARGAVGQSNIPVFVSDQPLADWFKPLVGNPGQFRTEGAGKPSDLTFIPFYRLHRRTYGAYWDIFTNAEWESRQAAFKAEQGSQDRLQQATVAFVQPGEMQPERDFNYQAGEDTQPIRLDNRFGRSNRSWFSFDVPVDASRPVAFFVTYYSQQNRANSFDILVDGQRVGQQIIENSSPARFFDNKYTIPANLVAGKQRVTIRFQATGGNEIATVFGIRMIRDDSGV